MQNLPNILKKILPFKLYYLIRRKYLLFSNNPTVLDAPSNFHVNLEKFNKALPGEPELNSEASFRPFVYIISPMQRSGTNFLDSVLNLHEQIYSPKEDFLTREHFLLFYGEDLLKFCEKTYSIWHKWTGKNDPLQQRLFQNLTANIGNSLINFFYQFVPNGKTMLLRTPDAQNIKCLPYLFPQCKTIILLRDGKDTVQSFVDSWGGDSIFKDVVKRWRDRMSQIQIFTTIMKESGLHDQYMVVHYEDIHNQSHDTIKKILDFLNLDHHGFDWIKLDDMPVLGSSHYKGQSSQVHWNPLKKVNDFSPIGKWKNWDKSKLKLFERLTKNIDPHF